MYSWYDKISSYHDPDPAGVILILMYLSMGNDYPYNMAKNFDAIFDNFFEFENREYQEEIHIDERNEKLLVRYCMSTPNIKISSPFKKLFGLNSLRHPNKLASLLKDLEEKQLVNSVPLKSIRRRQYYELNPEIFQSDPSSPGKSKDNIKKLDKEMPNNTIEDQIRSFLSWFKEQHLEKNKKIEELNLWCTSPLLDYITFLEFINEWVLKWEADNREEMDRPKLSEYMNKYIHHLLKKHDKKVYIDTFRRPFFPVEKIMRSNENPWLQADR